MLGGQWEGRSEGSGNRNGLGWMGGLGEGEREMERFGSWLEISKLRLTHQLCLSCAFPP